MSINISSDGYYIDRSFISYDQLRQMENDELAQKLFELITYSFSDGISVGNNLEDPVYLVN